jgi:ATP-dependent DNA helicase PIF1
MALSGCILFSCLLAVLWIDLAFSFSTQGITPRSSDARKVDRQGAFAIRSRNVVWEEDRLLSAKQQEALDVIQEGSNVFITGVAGTGKSLLLRRALEYLDQKYDKRQYVAVGPTGPAAIALEGQTIHSFAGIGIPRTISDFMKVKNKKKQWKDLKVLVLDEASMVSGEFFDLLSDAVSEIRKDPRPFGGIQLVICGDFLQLSPIAPRNSDIEQMVDALLAKEGLNEREAREMLFLNRGFTFQAYNWQKANFRVVELDQVFRQQNKQFIDILQDIRKGHIPPSTLEFLRTKCQRPLPPNEFGIRPTILHSRNRDVSRDNLVELQKLQAKTVIYESSDKIKRDKEAPKWADDQLWKNQFFNNCIAEEMLQLKVGAQVMLVKNEGAGPNQLVNGSRGTVVGYRKPPRTKAGEEVVLLSGVDTYPVVQFVHGAKKLILPTSFESRVVGLGTCTRLAIPLKLAWAITTHKAQGLTLDYVIADLGEVFAEAQAYVALSRASDENGLELRNFSPSRVRANRMALAFYDNPDQEFPLWNGKNRSLPPSPAQPRPPQPSRPPQPLRPQPIQPPEYRASNVALSFKNDRRRKTIVLNESTPVRAPSSAESAPVRAPSPAESAPVRAPSSAAAAQGRTFVFSGVLRFLNREKAETLVRKHGGLVRKSVSGNTDILVLGRTLKNGKSVTEGAEYKKAASLTTERIRMITEEDFLEMIKSI